MTQDQLAAGVLVADRFRLTAPLGKGGQGTVWEAVDLRQEHAVCALKFTTQREAISEFTALSELEHRSLPRALGVVTHAQYVVLVSERVSGVTLDRVTDQALVVRALFDCADALASLHDRGLVHGDLKPANIVVGADRAWLVDFGLARESSTIAGTLAFLAPEAFAGERSAASDLFALGVTAFLTLAHEHPFVDPQQLRESFLEALSQGLTLRPSVREKLAAPLHAAVLPLLSTDPRARGSARALMARLHRDGPQWLTSSQRERAHHIEQNLDGSLALVGRHSELERCRHLAQRLLSDDSLAGVLVCGREGSGRKRLTQELLRMVRVRCAAQSTSLRVVDRLDSAVAAPLEVDVAETASVSEFAAATSQRGVSGSVRRANNEPTAIVLPRAELHSVIELSNAIGRVQRLRGPTRSAMFVLATCAELAPDAKVPDSIAVIALESLDRASMEQLLQSALGRNVTPLATDAFVQQSEGLAGRCVRLLRAMAPDVAATTTPRELAKVAANLQTNRIFIGTLTPPEQLLFVQLAISARPWSIGVLAPQMPQLRELAARLCARGLATLTSRDNTVHLSLEHKHTLDELEALPPTLVHQAAQSVLEIFENSALLTVEIEARCAYLTQQHARAATAALAASRLASQDGSERLGWLALAHRCRPGDLQIAHALVRGLLWAADAAGALRVLDAIDSTSDALLLRADVLRLQADRDGLESLLQQLARDESASMRAVARVIRARMLVEKGDWEGAHTLLKGTDELAQCSDSTRIRFGETLAFVALNQGRLAEAHSALDAIDELVARCDEPRVIARIESLTGMIAQAQEDHRRARAHYERAWTTAAQVGDDRAAATYAANLGGAELLCGSLGAAKSWYTRAVESLAAIGSRFELARALANLASLELFLGDRGRAAALATQAVEEAEQVGDPIARAMAKMIHAESHLSVKSQANVLYALAQTELAAQRNELALELFLHSVMAAAAVNDRATIVAATESMAGLDPAARDLNTIVARAVAAVALDEHSQHQRIEEAQLALEQTDISQLELWVLQWRVRAAQRQSESAYRRAKSQLDAKISALATTLPESAAALFRDVHRTEPLAGGVEHAAERSSAELRWRRLAELARELNSESRLRPLLEKIMDAVVELTGASRGFLLLAGPDGVLRVRTARNIGREDLSLADNAPSRSIAEQVASRAEALFSVDASADQRLSSFESVSALKLRSVLAVPIVIHGHPSGTIYVDDRFKVGAFGDSALAVTQEFAHIAAIAIYNARSAARLRRALRQSERLQKKLAKRVVKQGAALEASRRALTLPDEVKGQYDGIIGRGAAMRKTLALCDRVAATAVSVLLLGETGTGKELLARAIHGNSPRSRRPFVAINCGALTETLLESELFGHLRGSFTGADRARQGLFEVAHGGTIFLDEVAEMSPSMQTKLLRVLQEGEVRPVGSTVARKVDVRVIAATHRDVVQMVAARTFREDLYYRLAVMTVTVAPLRERREDIVELVKHVLAKHHRSDVKIERKAMARLMDYAWPGNVRQLENEVQRAALLCDGVIHESDLDKKLLQRELLASALDRQPFDLRAAVEQVERELVERALREHQGNQTRAAVALGVSRFGLQKMLKRLKITKHYERDA
jgi:transcriptional regulator with GAF, ATPase, and Fis domain